MAFLRHLRPPLPLFSSSCTRIRRTICNSRFTLTSSSPSPAKSQQNPYYITTPIFYPNASPHIGHLYSLVTGDVFARYQRLKGRDVEFLTGTDEHGMKIQRAARLHFGEGGREREFCDALSERFRDLGRRANISNTCFMRTSSEEHHRAVKHVWRDLYAKGYIYKSQYAGWYSITDESFYTDAQVSASPPPPSGGDGHSISLETGSVVEWSSEENYMFRLSAFREALLQHYSSNPRSVYPPQYHENVLAMLGAAPIASTSASLEEDTSKVALVEDFVLGDISISRPRSRLEWGVPVPDDPEQTVYVWFDALLIYLTGAGYPWSSTSTSTPAGAWPADIQVIGKDILRFHAIYLPAIILALSGGPYQPSSLSLSSPASSVSTASSSLSPSPSSAPSSPPIPLSHTLLTHAHWTSSQKKMSKSLGNVADPLEAMDKYGVDVVRFYMMRVGGRWRGDVDWSEEQLEKHHREIQAQLGNYFLRITSPRIAQRAQEAAEDLALDDVQSGLPQGLQALFLGSGNDVGIGEAAGGREGAVETIPDPNYELLKLVLALPGKFEECMDQLEAGQALAEIMTVLKIANKTLTEIAPWSPTTPPQLVHTTRLVALETLRVVGVCLGPFMPGVSASLLGALGVGDESVVGVKSEEGKLDRAEMGRMWERWKGREVKGVKLF